MDDDNPSRFYEPLSTGPKSGSVVGKASMEKMKQDYYAAVGWDMNGVSRSGVLRRLGLESVERVLKGTFSV